MNFMKHKRIHSYYIKRISEKTNPHYIKNGTRKLLEIHFLWYISIQIMIPNFKAFIIMFKMMLSYFKGYKIHFTK